MRSETLSQLTGANVWLKFENLQFTAAYKERGALNRLLQLGDNAKKAGVIEFGDRLVAVRNAEGEMVVTSYEGEMIIRSSAEPTAR